LALTGISARSKQPIAIERRANSLRSRKTVPEWVSGQLIQIGSRGEMLDQDRQAFKNLQLSTKIWEWEKITRDLAQGECELLIQGFVIVERELKLLGGSVSAVIKMFRCYEERFAPDHIELANWVLENRGKGQRWIPFGGQTEAENYDEYLVEEQESRLRYQFHKDTQSRQQKAKERRKRERFSKSLDRQKEQTKRAAQVREINSNLKSLSISDRLQVIVSSDIPLEAVSQDLLLDAPDTAASLELELKSKLIQKIGRRKRGIWGRVKRVLT
jgi:hypothetical protein